MEHTHVWGGGIEHKHACVGSGMKHKHVTKDAVFNINTCGG